MTPAQNIASRDRNLARNGEDVILTRNTIGPNSVQIPVSVKVRAKVSGYQPQELIAGSGIVQGDVKIIISPTQIDAAQWPGTVPTNPKGDPRIPIAGDTFMVAGRTLTVKAAIPRRIDDVLVRMECQARG